MTLALSPLQALLNAPFLHDPWGKGGKVGGALGLKYSPHRYTFNISLEEGFQCDSCFLNELCHYFDSSQFSDL